MVVRKPPCSPTLAELQTAAVEPREKLTEAFTSHDCQVPLNAKMRLSILIAIFATATFCHNILAYKIANICRQLPSQQHTELHADTSAIGDCVQDPNTYTAAEAARLAEWERRKKKENICKSMPRSQKWFKAKQQHVSPNQKRMYNDFWPVYGINLKYGSTVIPHELFPKFSSAAATPVVLDIGFGTGDSIVGMSQQNTDKIYLGCEIHRAGISIVLGNLSSLAIENVKIIRADVTMLLESYLKTRCLDEVCIFFPDPWPNTERDGERRVVRRGTRASAILISVFTSHEIRGHRGPGLTLSCCTRYNPDDFGSDATRWTPSYSN